MASIYNLHYDYIMNGRCCLVLYNDEALLPINLIKMQVHMLQTNAIPGLLPFDLEQLDNKIRFRYDITSKKKLTQILKSRQLSDYQMTELLFHIAVILSDSISYLLTEHNFVIDSDFIFVDAENYHVYLAYIPINHLSSKATIQHDLITLIHCFDPMTNHFNNDISRRFRDLIAFLESESFSLKGFKQKLLHLKNNPESGSLTSVNVPFIDQVKLKQAQFDPSKLRTEHSNGFIEYIHKVIQSIVEKLMEHISKSPAIRDQSDYEVYQENHLSQTTFLAPLDATVLLKIPETVDNGKENKAERAYIEIRGGDTTDLVELDKDCFVIGKGTEGVHYTIDSIGISRQHIEIKSDGNLHLVQDLSSKNGTIMNDTPLVPYKLYPFGEGDLIKILKYELSYKKISQPISD